MVIKGATDWKMFYLSKDIKFREMGEENIVLCTRKSYKLRIRAAY